jgi:hypothetical protein
MVNQPRLPRINVDTTLSCCLGKNCKALLKKVVIGRAVTALKQQKSKGKGEEKGIAEVVHLMKPITRSPHSSSSSSSSSSSNKYKLILK